MASWNGPKLLINELKNSFAFLSASSLVTDQLKFSRSPKLFPNMFSTSTITSTESASGFIFSRLGGSSLSLLILTLFFESKFHSPPTGFPSSIRMLYFFLSHL